MEENNVVTPQVPTEQVQDATQIEKVENPDGVLAKNKQLLSKMAKQNEELEAFRQAATEREEQARTLEDTALAEQGKYKELLDKSNSKYEKLKEENKIYKQNEKVSLEEKEAEKLKLLESFPEDKRDIYKDASINMLKDILSQNDKPNMPTVVSTNQVLTKEDLSGMTHSQRQLHILNNR